MDISLPFNSIAALFGALFVLALIPSVSVLAVSARSAACGFTHGALTAAGIVTGDIVFIVVAIYGLSMLADAMDHLFVVVKYLGGAYLVWLGVRLWRSGANSAQTHRVTRSSRWSSFLSGLLITLGDQKAIVFYLGFFPAFVDVSTVTTLDAGVIVAIAIVAVGGAKLGYAFMADRASLVFDSVKAVRVIHALAGSVVIAIGVFLLATS